MSHDISLAVWDLASLVVAGRRVTLKVGVACPDRCDLTGARVEVYDASGVRIAGGHLGAMPWSETDALYWTELDVAAPNAEGEHAWTIRATTPEATHASATSSVRFVACGSPEHRVTLEAIERDHGVPLAGVELRVGRFRAATNDAGIGHVDVPRGTYDVVTWKNGYQVLSQTVAIAGDTTIRLELIAEPQLERPYWM